jgi:hypothetical protein
MIFFKKEKKENSNVNKREVSMNKTSQQEESTL